MAICRDLASSDLVSTPRMYGCAPLGEQSEESPKGTCSGSVVVVAVQRDVE